MARQGAAAWDSTGHGRTDPSTAGKDAVGSALSVSVLFSGGVGVLRLVGEGMLSPAGRLVTRPMLR